MMKSAEAWLQATGMFHTTAIRRSAFTSGSCGRGWSGSQKKSGSGSESALCGPLPVPVR
jgi:hypothetical protein